MTYDYHFMESENGSAQQQRSAELKKLPTYIIISLTVDRIFRFTHSWYGTRLIFAFKETSAYVTCFFLGKDCRGNP